MMVTVDVKNVFNSARGILSCFPPYKHRLRDQPLYLGCYATNSATSSLATTAEASCISRRQQLTQSISSYWILTYVIGPTTIAPRNGANARRRVNQVNQKSVLLTRNRILQETEMIIGRLSMTVTNSPLFSEIWTNALRQDKYMR